MYVNDYTEYKVPFMQIVRSSPWMVFAFLRDSISDVTIVSALQPATSKGISRGLSFVKELMTSVAVSSHLRADSTHVSRDTSTATMILN